MEENKQTNIDLSTGSIEPALPTFGLAIACEKPNLQLCKPKLLPLKTYSYIRMQAQAKNRLDQELTSKTSNDK